MNTNNADLSHKEKLLGTNTTTVQKRNQWTIYDLENDIDSDHKSPYSSTGSLVPTILNNDNNDSGALYRDDNLSKTESRKFSSSSRRRGSFILSDSESNCSSTSTLLAQSNTRRRALSTTPRPKDRFSMHELGASDDKLDNSRFLSRHSMAFDNRFNINNEMIRNSLEDRERIGNAGKGFGNLINDESKKSEESESIANLIADVKDEDAIKFIALITQKHAGQKNRTLNNTDADLGKNIAGIKNFDQVHDLESNSNFEFHPSETTLSNSKMCKQYLENKYHVLFKIINNNGVYNPLPIVKNRKNDMAREGSDYSLGSGEKFSGGNSHRLNSKSRGSLPRHKELSIWDVSHMEIFKDYEQRNKFDQIRPGKQIVNEIFDDKGYQLYKVESEPNESKKRPKLPQMFNPLTTQETQTMSSLEERGEKGGSIGESKGIKHSRSLSTAAISQEKEDPCSKSKEPKKWHLFKRRDKKHKNELSSPDIGNDNFLALQTNEKSVSDLSSGDQSSRSSVEDVRFPPEKDNDSLQINSGNILHNNERIHYEPGFKGELEVPEEKHNHNQPPDYLTDDASSQRNSLDTSIGHSNNSSARNSVDLGWISSRRNTVESLNIEEKLPGHEQHEDNRLSSENKIAEYSTESDEEYEEEIINERVGETVLVKLDVLPQELIKLVADFQEQGIVDRNIDNGHFVELDIRLNENFKFHKLIGYGVDILDLQISLIHDNAEDTRSKNQQEADETIKRCDEYIEEATRLLEANEILLADRDMIIKNNNYVSNETHSFESLDIPFVNSPISMNSSDISTYPNINQQNYHPSQPIVAEHKMNIEEGIKLLNDKLFSIENTVNKLESQHASFSEEMNIMLDKIDMMAEDVNNDYFRELKILEDEIHLLIAEKGKSLDIFYWVMSYVLEGVMLMFWFIVACFNLFKRIFRKVWGWPS